MVLAVQMEDTLMMIQPNRKKPQMMVTSLILFSRFFITIVFCVFRFLFHETVRSTCCRCLGLLRHTFTEVSGGESGVALRNHPRSQVRNEVQTFQCYDACRHQVACGEECV